MLDAQRIKELIDHYNERAPRDSLANPKDLILADNKVTETIKSHYGTLSVAVVEGGYGSGKTSSALKIFHDLKDKTYVTYASARNLLDYVRSIGIKTNVNGRPSFLATLIALLLTRSKKTSEVDGLREYVLTNAQDIDLDINSELSDLLERYSKKLAEIKKKHVLLIDELEQALTAEEDLMAIAICMVTLRRLFDKGYSYLTIVFFIPPIRPGSRAYEVTKGGPLIDRIKEFVKTIVLTTSHDPEGEARYIFDKVFFGDLEDPNIIKEIYEGFIERVNSLLSKLGGNYKTNLVTDKVAIELLASVTKYVRFGKDLLVEAIVKSIEEQKSLKDCIVEVLKDKLDLDGTDPIKVLRYGKFGAIDFDLINFKEVIERSLRKLKDERVITGFSELETRHAKGFESVTYMVTYYGGARKPQEKLTVTFWLRLSDLTDKGLSKVNTYFKNKDVILVTTLNAKHGAVVSSAIKSINIIRLPSEMIYYIIARNRIRDRKLLDGLERKFNEDYMYLFEEALRNIMKSV